MRLRLTNSLILLIFWVLTISTSSANEQIEHRIAVLVNEQVITSYDIIQRLKLTAIIKNININAQNNQIMVNNVVDELIQEKVKLDKINEYKININEDEYLDFEKKFFQTQNIDRSSVINLLNENQINYDELKSFLIVELSWNKLVNGLFARLTSASNIEIQEIIVKNPNISEEQAESLIFQRQLELQSSKLLRDIMNEATIEYK